jgi:hypothetical protein
MHATSGIDGAWIAAISAMGAIIAGSVAALATYWLTRHREHENEWRRLRLEKYQEFLLALSGIIQGRSTDEAQARFADAVNTIALVAPMDVYRKVRAFHEHNAASNPSWDRVRHDMLLNEVIRAMRTDVHPALRNTDDTMFYMISIPGGAATDRSANDRFPVQSVQ